MTNHPIILDADNAVVFGPTPWVPSVFAARLAELLVGGEIGSVPLGDLPCPAEVLSWEGVPFRILPCFEVRGDYDPSTQTLGGPNVEVDEGNDAATAVYTPMDKPLAEVQAWAISRIDREAETVRSRFLTPGSGQALEYERTRAEATLAATLPDEQLTPDAFPWLEAERLAMEDAGVLGVTLRAVEEAVNAQFSDWNTAGSGIKRLRRAAKLRVEAATEVAQIRALFPLAWPEN